MIFLECKQVEDTNSICNLIQANNDLFVVHLNIRSIKNRNHFAELETLIASFTHKPDVIAITESWLEYETDINYVQLNGYNNEFYIRNGTKGGGIILYISEKFQYSVLNQYSLENAESVWVELKHNGVKCKTVIGCVYRPPSTEDEKKKFITEMDNIFEKISLCKKQCIITGDFNIDVSNESSALHYLNVLECNGFYNCINLPTRVTENTETIIDHFYSNIECKGIKTGTLNIDISDHKLIFCIVKNIICKTETKESTRMFLFSDENIALFLDNMSKINWSSVYSTDDVNIAYNNFIKYFQEAMNHVIIYNNKDKKLKCKLWITKGIKKSIKTKYKLYRKTVKQPFNIELKNHYNKYKNVFAKVFRNAELLYYRKKIANCSNNKTLWNTINEALNKKGKFKCAPSEIALSENKTTTDPIIICNSFNDFFVNVGQNINNSIITDNNVPLATSYIETEVSNSMYIMPVNEQEVEKYINQLDCTKACGADNIHPKLVKVAKMFIIKPLTYIFNMSLKTGIFPDNMKIARVMPIYKHGDKASVGNYRPISVLSVFSKFLEKVMKDRLSQYLNKNNLLYPYQYGFRTGYNTSLALAELSNLIKLELENGNVCLGLFVDLKKAFDSVNHSIMCDKLNLYGIRGIALKWFKNYLSNRQQYVELNNAKSDLKSISVGVPQGSILGPTLYLLYVNDMYKSLKYGKAKLYADDTNIFYMGNNIKELTKQAQSDVDSLCNWLKANKLVANSDKTNYMVFRSYRSEVDPNIDLKFNKNTVSRVENCKYLGVYLDECLNWKTHVEQVCKKNKN
jgi:hypothetical protein